MNNTGVVIANDFKAERIPVIYLDFLIERHLSLIFKGSVLQIVLLRIMMEENFQK
jgi:hypothetical protein